MSSTRKVVKVAALLQGFVCSPLYAQSTPSEFAELSLRELMHHSIDDENSAATKKWSFSYSYRYGEFEGYLDGDSSRSFSEVLFVPGETRTDDNFPVLPTEITQEVHLLTLGYALDSKTNVQISLPYIKQGTDHISSVPNYPEFLLTSSGIGDIALRGNFQVLEKGLSTLWVGVGVSLPTGSIDEVGDTPREPGNQQLPYTMQLGSGTYDFPVLIEHHYANKWRSFFSATIRSGSNDRNYRLGNSYSTGTTYQFDQYRFLTPSLGMSYKYTDSINGRDEEITVPNPDFPFPAGITNPDLYGGHIVSANTNLRFNFNPEDKRSLDLSFSVPLYQYLNGPQPKKRWSIEVKYGFGF